MRLALSLFLIPFVFVYNPSLLSIGSYGNIAQTFLTTLLGIIGMGMVVTGYYKGNLSLTERTLCGLCALLLIVPETYTDIAGTIGILAIIFFRTKRYDKKVLKS